VPVLVLSGARGSAPVRPLPDNDCVPTNESEQSEDARPPAQEKNAGEPMLYCPVCSTRLSEFKCKLVCAKCGYYMSCSDYY